MHLLNKWQVSSGWLISSTYHRVISSSGDLTIAPLDDLTFIKAVTSSSDHIDHIRSVAGVDHIGIGSDYDGIHVWVQWLSTVSSRRKRCPQMWKRMGTVRCQRSLCPCCPLASSTPSWEHLLLNTACRKSAKTLPVLVGGQMVAKIWRTLTASGLCPSRPASTGSLSSEVTVIKHWPRSNSTSEMAVLPVV